nr:immunoglobulin light chain junction region [Macaca mulatta]MOW71376.1 immunoglobulin light chain junction region [Macaca mulatta]
DYYCQSYDNNLSGHVF